MSRIKEFYIKYLSWINAYWLVTIVFLIVTFTVGDSSLYKRYTYDEKIRGLEKEIKHYQKEIEINSKKLNDLHTDKEGIAVCYLTLPVKDLDFRRRRLHRFNVFAGLLMIVSSGFMFNNRTEWILCLSVAAILQVYTAFVTPKE